MTSKIFINSKPLIEIKPLRNHAQFIFVLEGFV